MFCSTEEFPEGGASELIAFGLTRLHYRYVSVSYFLHFLQCIGRWFGAFSIWGGRYIERDGGFSQYQILQIFNPVDTTIRNLPGKTCQFKQDWGKCQNRLYSSIKVQWIVDRAQFVCFRKVFESNVGEKTLKKKRFYKKKSLNQCSGCKNM
jgi:hypothetical protein